MIMSTLKEKLEDFEKQIKETTKQEDLQILFEKLAPAFLYGGFIQVREDYKVYIRTVEFYFHSEKPNGVHDPIVYHRNKRDVEGNVLMEVPYFPLLTLHAHASGFDITFENEKIEYRASALIRAYEVKDKNGKYLKWDKEKRMFLKTSDYWCNTQSTYLYDMLNGFALEKENNIIWVDYLRPHTISNKGKNRQNVFQSESEFVYKKIEGKRCERSWSFTRNEII